MKIKTQLTSGSALVLLSASHWFPVGVNLLELLSAFAHFTLGVSILVLLVAVFFRCWVLISASAASMVICGALVIPHFSGLTSSEVGNFSIGQFNAYHHNPSPMEAMQEMAETATDVFILQELNKVWAVSVDSIIKKEYPFFVEEPWDNCCYGIGLYSKYPILSSRVFDLESTPAIEATVKVNGKAVTVISFHTKTPVFPNETEERNLQLQKIASMVRNVEGPIIVMGDWNIVPWDATFKSFLKTASLKAVRSGFQATFPMDLGIPLIPIDHIACSGIMRPTACKTIRIPGSDHLGLIASFKMEYQL